MSNHLSLSYVWYNILKSEGYDVSQMKLEEITGPINYEEHEKMWNEMRKLYAPELEEIDTSTLVSDTNELSDPKPPKLRSAFSDTLKLLQGENNSS